MHFARGGLAPFAPVKFPLTPYIAHNGGRGVQTVAAISGLVHPRVDYLRCATPLKETAPTEAVGCITGGQERKTEIFQKG